MARQGLYLSIGQCDWFGQVSSLGIELQKRSEVTTPHSIVQPAGICIFSMHDVATLCVLRHYVLLSGIPGRVANKIFVERELVMQVADLLLVPLESLLQHSHIALRQWFDRVIWKARLHDVVESGVANTDGQLKHNAQTFDVNASQCPADGHVI